MPGRRRLREDGADGILLIACSQMVRCSRGDGADGILPRSVFLDGSSARVNALFHDVGTVPDAAELRLLLENHSCLQGPRI